MADMMEYPKTPNEFIKSYSFKDSDEIYTNGDELVPVFRVEQMLEHYYKPLKEKAIPKKVKEIHIDEYYCPNCGTENNCDDGKVDDKYCSECGQALGWSEEE